MKTSGEDMKGMTFEDFQKGSTYMLTDLGDDCWQLTENIMGQTVSMKVPMNKEVDYTFPGYEKKMLWTRHVGIFVHLSTSVLICASYKCHQDLAEQGQDDYQEQRWRHLGRDEDPAGQRGSRVGMQGQQKRH